MATPPWQEILRLRLVERNEKESAFSVVIEQYRKLAQQTKILKERNATLLRAASSVRNSPNGSAIGPQGEESNPVTVAYMSALESQISSLRDEIATVYKTQGQNAQRLLSMNETLREKEEGARIDAENLRKARDEVTTLKRKVDQHAEMTAEKDRTVQILNDEISTLQLELGQIEDRNQTLTKDNAKLLQRWLDAKQAEANKMNEANQFYESMRSRHQAVLNWRDTSEDGSQALHNGADMSPQPSTSASGKGDANGEGRSAIVKEGATSPAPKTMDLTPNG